MATDNEQLVLSISADVRQIQRQLKGLVGQTQRDTKAIEAAFGGIDQAATGAFNGVVANSNRAGRAGADAGRKLESAMKGSAVQTGNLAAQLNDIGVQLAGGQSPFLIALQQGSQINQVLGQGGARAAVGALAGAFTSLVNPVSLATIAIISLGGAAVQYFTSLLSDSDKSAEALEKQAQLIRNVAKEWGDAVPALRDYVAELDNIQKLGDLQAATKGAIGQVLDESLTLLPQVRDAAVEAMTTAANSTQETRMAYAQLIADMGDVENAVGALNSAYQDGEDTTAAMERVNAELADVFNSSVIPATGALRELIDQLAGSFASAAGQASNLANQAAAAVLNASQLPALGTLTPLESVNGKLTGDTIAIQNARAEETKSQTQVAAEAAAKKAERSGRGARTKAANEAERERKAVTDLIEQLEFEQSLIGLTDQQREVANALRRAGAAATDEQRAKIEQLVEATYAEREALKANQEAMKELQAIGKDVLQGIVSDLRAGKSGADILANALDRIIDKIASSAIDSLFAGFGSGGGKGGLLGGLLIPGILHSGGVAGKDGYGHGRAVSPSVFSGAKRYHKGGVAGLMPGEVPAILQRGEVVIPRGAKMGGGSETITVNLQADRSVIAEMADQRIQTASGTIVQVAVSQSNRQAPAAMARYQNDKAGAEWR